MTAIYYVGCSVAVESNIPLSALLNRPYKKFHTTLAYSRKWFPYKAGQYCPLVIEPPFTLERFGEIAVLRYSNYRLLERHKEFLEAGATWGYTEFKGHISLGKGVGEFVTPKTPILLSGEYYGTWEE